MLQRKNNVIVQKADTYSDRIVKMSQNLVETKKEYNLSKQVLRSGPASVPTFPKASMRKAEPTFSAS